MTDNTPVALSGVSCNTGGGGGTTTSDNSWWRRFYFSEYGSPGSAAIESVTIAIEAGPVTPITINLYTIPHSNPVDTITIEDLTLIGTGSGTNDGTDLQSLTIPVTATVADAAGNDLVVEYHIDGSDDGLFFNGANGTTETHPSFLSSEGCGLSEPATAASIGQPGMHTIMIVNLGTTGPGAPNLSKAFAPASIPVGGTSTLTITLGNQSQPGAATLSSALTDTFPAGLVVATTPNAATTCGGTATVTAAAGSGSVSLSSGATIPASGSCTVTVDVTSATGGSYANSIPAGALATDLGNNGGAANATLLVIPAGGGNGIIASGPLNHLIADNTFGTSLNMVTSAFDDTGPISGDWDYNFWDNSGLDFWVVGTHNAQFAVDGSGDALVFQPGDVIGSSLTFGGDDGELAPVAAWLAGTDGYAGVKFDCDGRLTFPVASTVCYGYIHITTTGTTGFPATIVDTAFDGDGNAITIVGGGPLNDPSATVTPTSLSFTVAANATATDTLNIANAAGSSPLTFSIAAQGVAKTPKLVPHVASTATSRSTHVNANLVPKQPYLARNRPAGALAGNGQRSTQRASSPWVPTGSIAFQLDDGTADNFFGLGIQSPASEAGAVFINRFTATDALTIDSISIFWGTATQTGSSLQGLQANLVVYYDADGDGDVTNAVRVGTDDLVSITTLGDFQTYTTNFSIPAAGDVYVGFVDQWALAGGYTPRIFPGAIDQTDSQGKSYLSGASQPPTDITNLANNDLTGVIDDLSASLAGNLMIRATGTGGGGGGPCTGPVVPWLTATPASGSVSGGANTDVAIKADPTAGSLAAGTYTAELCVTTNDPTQALISVPVSLTVTAAASTPCSGGADEIFCDGFDGTGSGGGPGVYDTRAEFITHVAAGFFENAFDDVQGDSAASPALHYTDATSGIAYTIDTLPDSDDLFNAPGIVSTNGSGDQLIVTFTGTPVTAVGGNFYASDVSVSPIVGNQVVLTLSDGTTETLTTASATDFRGFTTAAPITSITIDAPNPADPTDNSWSTLDNLIVGSAQ